MSRAAVGDASPPSSPCMTNVSRDDRATRLNSNYTLCGSYPSVLVVPASVTDDEIRAVSLFRSEQRLPVLCWGRQRDSASIWRSSQPKVRSGRVKFGPRREIHRNFFLSGA